MTKGTALGVQESNISKFNEYLLYFHHTQMGWVTQQEAAVWFPGSKKENVKISRSVTQPHL